MLIEIFGENHLDSMNISKMIKGEENKSYSNGMMLPPT